MVSHFSDKIYILNQATKRIFKENIIPKYIQNCILKEIKQIENDKLAINISKNIIDLGIKCELIYDISTALNKYYKSKENSRKLETGASIPEEDDWMEWEVAENMLKVWKRLPERLV